MKIVLAFITIFTISVCYAEIGPDDVLSCKPKAAYVCEPTVCKAINTPITEVIVDLKSKRYYRCDATGCDMRDVKISMSGAFLYASYGDGAGAIKIQTEDTPFAQKDDFMDNASLHFMNFLLYGACTKK